jgi:hypothetical protein
MVAGANPKDFFSERSTKKTPSFTKKTSTTISSKDSSTQKRGNAYRHTKSGYREDLDLNMRSNWEANFARILNRLFNQVWVWAKGIHFSNKKGN